MLDIVEVYQWYAGSRDVGSLPLSGVGGPGGAGFESGTDSIEGVQSLIWDFGHGDGCVTATRWFWGDVDSWHGIQEISLANSDWRGTHSKNTRKSSLPVINQAGQIK